MAFDTVFAIRTAEELNTKLYNSKVERIIQPTKDTVVMYIRCNRETLKLIISVNAASARISFTNENYENPSTPSMFNILLRKHLQGGVIEKVDTYGFERIIRMYFQAHDDLGFIIKRQVICELMGKYSNIILTDENEKILGVNRPVDFTENRVRQVLIGMSYTPPPKQDKINPCEVGKEEFKSGISELKRNNEKLDQDLLSSYLVKTYAGFSPCVAREIVYRSLNVLTSESYEDKLYSVFKDVLEKKEEKPSAVVDENGNFVEFSYIALKHFLLPVKEFDSFTDLLETYYYEKEISARLKSRVGNLENLINSHIKKAQRKVSLLENELAECKEADKYRRYGELITSSLYMLKNKAKYCDVIDYYSDNAETVRIPLDEKLTPSQNANRYFKKYTKLKSQKENATIQIDKTLSELEYLSEIKQSLANCETNDDAKEIRDELVSSGYLKEQINPKEKNKKKSFSPVVMTIKSGKTVRIGKNNTQNDYLTLKFSDKDDIWFHVKGAPGSHVVLENNGEEITDADYVECASIAAYYSSMKQSDNVPVDFTYIRYVKKPQGAHPGHVIFTDYSTIYVKPYSK